MAAKLEVIAIVPAVLAVTPTATVNQVFQETLAVHRADAAPGVCHHTELAIKQKDRYNAEPRNTRTYRCGDKVACGFVNVRFVSKKVCACGANIALVYSATSSVPPGTSTSFPVCHTAPLFSSFSLSSTALGTEEQHYAVDAGESSSLATPVAVIVLTCASFAIRRRVCRRAFEFEVRICCHISNDPCQPVVHLHGGGGAVRWHQTLRLHRAGPRAQSFWRAEDCFYRHHVL